MNTAPAETVADGCVIAFLGTLDEARWILGDAQRAPANDFGNTARRRRHITELRRLIDRRHQLHLQWEDAPP